VDLNEIALTFRKVPRIEGKYVLWCWTFMEVEHIRIIHYLVLCNMKVIIVLI